LIATLVTHRLLVSLAAVSIVVPGAGVQAPPREAKSALVVTAAARATQPGEVVVLTISGPAAASGIAVRALGQSWAAYRADASTWRALVGIDLETLPKTYSAVVTAGDGPAAARAAHDLVVKAKTFATRTLTVDDVFVNPPASEQGRIKEEAARLAAIWAHVSPERLWSAGFVAPVPETANSAFGKRSVVNGQPGSPHSGADFPSPAGEAVKAPGGGRVVLAEELYYSGNTVIIDHGLGLYSLLAHLSAIAVRKDDTVTPGDVVGKAGATGRVTGPHLHWSVRLGGARVDPLSLLAMFGAR
jgi:murein DD-endopeptidase MepM/ murein hydrolase activator NlpD